MRRRTVAVTCALSLGLMAAMAASTCRAIELLHWTFDQVDTDGTNFTTPDSSGRGNTGTLTSMDNTSAVPGRVGNALEFSGAGTSTTTRDRVQIGLDNNNPIDVITDLNRTYSQFTFAAFVKPVNIAEAELDVTWIAGKMGTGSTGRGWQIGLTGEDVQPEGVPRHPDEVIVSLFEGPNASLDNDNEFYSGPQTAVVNGEWAHVAFTFSAVTESSSFFRLYLNGEKVVEATTDLLQLNGANIRPFEVGNRGDHRADNWNGLIDDVYIFDHALTDEEIAALIPPLPPALPGDFNNDGVVDAADHVLWRKADGGTTALPNDNGLGTPITSAHYDLWVANYGRPGSGGGSLSAAAPEPASAILVSMAAGLLLAWRRRGSITEWM
ncbi:MAG TPA: LamG domain-containing protein [Lacipirellulaceae bacterium]